ncbi:MAG: DUF971 domain-containing protein [Chloroflexota bacterium]
MIDERVIQGASQPEPPAWAIQKSRINVMNSKPTGVKADKTKRIISITWADGHVSDLPFDGLRKVCPCVMCKGGHANMGRPVDPCSVRDAAQTNLMLLNIQPLGSYALQLSWSDGHDTGIFTWEFLRQADPVNCNLEK